MSQLVETAIRTHLQANDAVQETIEWAEIVSRLERGSSPIVVPRRSNRRGLWMAAAAAVITILLIGGVAWLTSFDGAVPPADQPTVTTVPVETSEDRIVLLAEAGPAPRFDTSPLGLEVVFETWQPGDIYDIWSHLSGLVANSGAVDLAGPGVADQREDLLMALISGPEPLTEPILYVGRATENGSELIVVTAGETRCSVLFPGYTAACGPSSDDDYGWAGVDSSETNAIVWVRVPLETSIVGIINFDGQRFWQRPIGGWGLLKLPLWPEGTPGPTAIAFDADGIQIGQWCEPPLAHAAIRSSGTPDPSNPDCSS